MLTKRQLKKVMEFELDGVRIVEGYHYESNFGYTQIWVDLKSGYNWDGCSSCVSDNEDGNRSMFRLLMSDLGCVVKGDPY